jgi:tetratricopeptide (TPR) repeat protein
MSRSLPIPYYQHQHRQQGLSPSKGSASSPARSINKNINSKSKSDQTTIDDRFTGIEFNHPHHQDIEEDHHQKACWPYNHFAATSSDEDDDDIIDSSGGGGGVARYDNNKIKVANQKPVVAQHRSSQPVDLDDIHPSDEDSEEEEEDQSPIEVTEDEYRRTVGQDNENRRRKKKNKNRKNMTIRIGIGSMLSPLTKKIGQAMDLSKEHDQEDYEKSLTPLLQSSARSTGNPFPYHDNNKSNSKKTTFVATNLETSSISGMSAQGQQSVANKTVDSFASTIKVSNRQEGEDGDDPGQGSGENKKKDGSSKIKKRTWKSLKRLVKGGGSGHGSSSSTNGDNYDNRGGYARGKATGQSSSRSVQSMYPIRQRVQSEDNVRSRGDYSANSNITWGVKSMSWGAGGWLKRASSSGEDEIGNSGRRDGGNLPQQQEESEEEKQRRRQQRRQQHMLDRAIRGRLDGTDILSLGPACRSTLSDLPQLEKSSKKSSNLSPNLLRKELDHNDSTSSIGSQQLPKSELDPLKILFTNLPSFADPSDLVSDVIWMSAGQEHTEIILEGFFPGGSDRWTVRLDDVVSSGSSAGSSTHLSQPGLKLTSTTDDESTTISSDGSPNLPSNRLWYNLWGTNGSPPPTPPHMKSNDDIMFLKSAGSGVSEEDLQHKFAASCNVPIDLDDDAFMVATPEHLYSVHEVIMLPIQTRRFDTAIGLFRKLLRGLEGADERPEAIQWMIGATYHNIGMMHLCQGHYGDALHNFQKAVTSRRQCLPVDHPDIAVSLARRGMAFFALNCLDEARQSFETALTLCHEEDATKAKITNNLAVVQYQLEDYAKAIKSFTNALEIQRHWLDGPVRREALVYDASITLANMGKCYLRKGDYDLAYYVFEEACLLQTSHFPHDHDIVLTSQDNMARVQATNGNHAEALRLFSSLARSQEARFGTDSEMYVETTGMKALAHYKLLEFEEADTCLKIVSAWQSKSLNRSSPGIKNTKQLVTYVKRCLKGDEPLWL